MSENRYEVIDPESDDYKLTGKDLLKKKKSNKGLKALLAIFLVLLIIVGSGGALLYSYLSKMNYGDSTGDINPDLDKDESLNFENQADADAQIRANLANDVLWYDDRIYNVLLVGIDLGDEEKVMFEGAYLPRSDSMILLSFNTITNTIYMVSLSRAVYVAIPGHGNKRLNTAHAYGGSSLLVDTIQQNYKIRIDKYITVDISGFEQIVDALDGVDVSLSQKEAKYVMGISQAGEYHLNGAKAISYSRLRSIDSDRARTGRQRAVLNAIAAKMRRSPVSNLLNMLNVMLPLVTTDFTKTELLGQIVSAPQYFAMKVNEDIIPHNATTLTMRDGKEVLILNWSETTKYIHDLLYPGIVPQSAKE